LDGGLDELADLVEVLDVLFYVLECVVEESVVPLLVLLPFFAGYEVVFYAYAK
jgi:hypothetical protein